MAFTSIFSGDRFGHRASSNVPKQFAAARYATPVVGHLVKQDTTSSFNDGVVQCVANDVPYGLVESINSSNGVLSIWKLVKTFSLVFEYTGSPTLGQQIQSNATNGTIKIGGFVRDVVKAVASPNGVGVIVAIDAPATGLLVVEFGS